MNRKTFFRTFIVLFTLMFLLHNEYDHLTSLVKIKDLKTRVGQLEEKVIILESAKCLCNCEENKKVIFPVEGKKKKLEVSAYNSTRKQTDNNPCEAADGSNICKRHRNGESLCASNKFPFGTVLYIDDYGTCTVADRTHKRNSNRIDLYFGKDVLLANAWGVRRLDVWPVVEG
jgi:3D (Asp-Asp-Asp) domain-containing protein